MHHWWSGPGPRCWRKVERGIEVLVRFSWSPDQNTGPQDAHQCIRLVIELIFERDDNALESCSKLGCSRCFGPACICWGLLRPAAYVRCHLGHIEVVEGSIHFIEDKEGGGPETATMSKHTACCAEATTQLLYILELSVDVFEKCLQLCKQSDQGPESFLDWFHSDRLQGDEGHRWLPVVFETLDSFLALEHIWLLYSQAMARPVSITSTDRNCIEHGHSIKDSEPADRRFLGLALFLFQLLILLLQLLRPRNLLKEHHELLGRP
eukprot:SM000188S03830  [mRNA]  locus=s188:215765:222570:+ [translate_table: standard]